MANLTAEQWAAKRRRDMLDGLRADMKPLVKFLKDCREDMHEPDEQEVRARVRGRKLDNAFGNSGEWGELVVVLKKATARGVKEHTINLATLIALARKANLE